MMRMRIICLYLKNKQAPIDPEAGAQSNQSQDIQQINQPLGASVSQPVLTKQGVMDLVAKDAGSHTPGSGWELTKQGYCGLLSGYESPNGSTVNVAIDLICSTYYHVSCLRDYYKKQSQDAGSC